MIRFRRFMTVRMFQRSDILDPDVEYVVECGGECVASKDFQLHSPP